MQFESHVGRTLEAILFYNSSSSTCKNQTSKGSTAAAESALQRG